MFSLLRFFTVSLSHHIFEIFHISPHLSSPNRSTHDRHSHHGSMRAARMWCSSNVTVSRALLWELGHYHTRGIMGFIYPGFTVILSDFNILSFYDLCMMLFSCLLLHLSGPVCPVPCLSAVAVATSIRPLTHGNTTERP